MDVSKILSMLGLKLSPEQVTQIQTLIPQLPAMLKGLFDTVQATIIALDTRLKGIENELRQLREELHGRTDNSDNGGDTSGGIDSPAS